ncbi:LysR family transcriptional regulator [Pontibacillus yanchengensis]|uniref:LysR family transcriptional regulator n=1 Tax=Pontibacillus yanchengensis TaxID=462910 RepID=A0ACC7VI85_9BACI|nr:LysR family transcriptional regulator [Pontibacillus yanchengensis]MYL54498.1 LysR family transcriptional regulator [Pontibacillus yanchengensis]
MNQSYRVFVEVVERQHFSRAAEALFMTQPAVSQYIKALESEIGTQLIDRSHKKVRLTTAGRIVYEHAKEMIGHHETMHHLIHELFHEPTGTLAIGASYTFGEYVLPRIMAPLRERFPHIQPTITISNTKEIAEKVEKMELDIGIVEGDINRELLQVEHFAEDYMRIVASSNHSYTEKLPVTVSDLENEIWITRELGSGTREATERMFTTIGIDPAHRMEFGSTQVIKESVEAGLGVSLVSLWALRKELSMNTLFIVDVPEGYVKRSFSTLLRKKPMQTKNTLVFKELLHEMVKE